MTNDSTEKGFIAILLISAAVLIGIGIISFLNYSQPKKLIKDNLQIVKSSSSEPLSTKSSTRAAELPKIIESDIDVAKIPNDGRLYLAINLPDQATQSKTNVFTKIPKNSAIIYSLTRDNELDIKMKVNEAEYNIKVPSGGTEGSCPLEEFGNQCGYVDEEIQTLSLVKINTLRIWRRENGVFLLNPFVITKDNFYMSHLEIIKTQPNNLFQGQEVNMWRDILKSISFEEVI